MRGMSFDKRNGFPWHNWHKWLWGLLLLVFLSTPLARAGDNNAPVKRVISLVPSITEMVFRLGAQKYLVGRTTYCTYPPQAQKLPSVGGYLDPDYETIVRLHADAVLLLPGAYYTEKFRKLELQTIELPDETIQDILFSLKELGKLFGKEARAQQVIAGIQDTLRWVQTHQAKRKLRALIIIGHEPGALRGLYVVSNGSFLGELWQLAGGENVFPQKKPRYFQTSMEDVVVARPEIILDIHGNPLSTSQKRQCKQLWQTFPSIPAVQQDHIVVLDQPGVLIPGPRIAQTAIRFHQIISHFAEK